MLRKCAQSIFHLEITLKSRFLKENRKKNFFRFSSKNRLFRVISRRKIDCAHSRSVKMLPWPWFREIDVCIEAKFEKFWNFSLKIIFLGVISCGESIAHIPEAWECFPDPDLGKWVFCIEAKILNFSSKIIVLRVILCVKSIQIIPEVSKCILDHCPRKIMFLPQRFGNTLNRFLA